MKITIEYRESNVRINIGYYLRFSGPLLTFHCDPAIRKPATIRRFQEPFIAIGARPATQQLPIWQLGPIPCWCSAIFMRLDKSDTAQQVAEFQGEFVQHHLILSCFVPDGCWIVKCFEEGLA